MVLPLVDIELIVYDFDGVMTDNKVYVDQHGNEFVQVSRADGLGISEMKKLGIKQIIISTETNPVVNKRAEKLSISCLQCVDDKEKELKTYCCANNVDLTDVLYVGNDINDKKAMELAGWAICPADAHESVKGISKYILRTKGGEGVVREILDLIIKKKGG